MILHIAVIGVIVFCNLVFAKRYAILVGNNNARGYEQLKAIAAIYCLKLPINTPQKWGAFWALLGHLIN
jgi:hypothetical protein